MPQPAAPPPPLTFAGSEQCAEAGCPSQEGFRCQYRDRRGATCTTALCPTHQVPVGGGVFCRRHAGVVRALLSVPEEERDYPELDNRAPSLCEWVSLSIHASVLHVLMAMAAQRPGSSVVSDGLHLVMTGTPRVRGWEHKWRLFDQTGPLQTAGIHIDEPTDTLVQVRVNGKVVYGAVPPWVGASDAASPEEDARRRVEFHQTLIDVMVEHLRQQVGFT